MKEKEIGLREILVSLKRVSDLYRKVDEGKRERLLQVCQKLFDRGEELGVERVWLESLVIGGKDFLDSLEESGWVGKADVGDVAEVVFS